jgi:hypothetical protein
VQTFNVTGKDTGHGCGCLQGSAIAGKAMQARQDRLDHRSILQIETNDLALFASGL